MDLADDGVAGHRAEARRNLARAQAFGPQLLEQLDALVVPRHAVVSPRENAMDLAASRAQSDASRILGAQAVTQTNAQQRQRAG